MSLLDAEGFPHTVTVSTPSYAAADAGGGRDVSYAAAYTNEPAQVDTDGGVMTEDYGSGQVLVETITVFFSRDVSVAPGSVLTWNGATYRFTGGTGFTPGMGSIPDQYSAYKFQRKRT